MKIIKTRFAPSPTGWLHLGGARTALYAWLVARQNQGHFLLRIEDTDQQRACPGAVENILEGLQWLGLHWDEGPYFQSERFELYRNKLQILLQNQQAYCCTCSVERLERLKEQQRLLGQKPRYDHHCRQRQLDPADLKIPYVIRFKTPLIGKISFEDEIRQEIQFDNQELDDLILWRSVQGPTYNFCVVIDDWLMGITHVVRGEDHVNNTPRQIHLLNAFQAPIPIYAHVPMIFNEKGEKLSKRHQAADLLSYREKGYLPQAMLNYLARLGWGQRDEAIHDLEGLIRCFNLSKVKRSASALDPDRLSWLNHHYLNQYTLADVMNLLQKPWSQATGLSLFPDYLESLVLFFRPHCNTWVDLLQWLTPLCQRQRTWTPSVAQSLYQQKAVCTQLKLRLSEISLWQAKKIFQTLQIIASDRAQPLGAVADCFRYIVTGREKAPNVSKIAEICGKDRIISWLSQAEKLEKSLCANEL